jgi:ABC-type bacteriocin/lantibiotic exporter with double-glycine peptidase domain
MSRSKAKPHSQPDEHSCGPAALKTALEILGVRKSHSQLANLCKTNTHGTTLPNLIKAANKCGISVLSVEWATLRHLQSVLKNTPLRPLAVIVDYLYDIDDEHSEDTGHYATVASFSSRLSKIVIFDSYTGKKKSYLWTDFLDRWYGFDKKRRKISHRRNKFKLSRKWHNRLLLILAKDQGHLPKFTTPTAKLFPA